jgi:hypothetical protein
MKFSTFVEGFLGLQDASSTWGGRGLGGGLSSNARVIARPPPRDDGAKAFAAAKKLAIALADAKRIAAASAVRAVATPAPVAPKPAVLVAPAPPPVQRPAPPPPPGPAEPEVPPVVEVVVAAPQPEVWTPPPAPAAAPPAAAAPASYGSSGGFDLGWLNSWRASVGAGPMNIDAGLQANARYTTTLGEHEHHLGDLADGQVMTPSFNERCTNQMLQAAGFPAYGQVETSLRLFACEQPALAGMDCPGLLNAIRMSTGGQLIHFNILSDPAFTKISCSCSNIDDGASCEQNNKCACDVQR